MAEGGPQVVLADLTRDEIVTLAMNAKASDVPRKPMMELAEMKIEIKKLEATQHKERHAPEAAADYLRIREIRHDLWLHYLSTTGIKFFDTKVYDLILKLTENDDRPWFAVPVDLLKRSPDLLCNYNGAIYVGDVAVSTRPDAVKMEKRLKYAEITQMFRQSGFTVKEVYFVVDTDLHNMNSEINNAKEQMISTTAQPPRVSHNSCNGIMQSLKDNCTDKGQMLRIIATDTTTSIVECPIPDYWPNETLPPVQAVESEDEIINHLQQFVRNNINTYFDKDYNDASAAFKQLWKTLKSKVGEDVYMRPRMTIPIVYNCGDYEEKKGHDLVEDYVNDIDINAKDSDERHFLLSIIPGRHQLRYMKEKIPNESQNTYGEWQYKFDTTTTEPGRKLSESLGYSSTHPNDKKKARSVDPQYYDHCSRTIESMIDYLSQESKKPPIFSGQWQAKTHEEVMRGDSAKRVFTQVSKSNGAQLCLALNTVCQRLNHLPTKLGQKTNVIAPPSGAFILIMFEGHGLLSDSKCSVPFMTVCRYKSKADTSHLEYAYKLSTIKYDYYISKCARLPLSKITLWDQADFTALSTISCLIEVTGNNMDEMMRKRTIGTLCILMLDSHQKTSELLELIKYVSFMPFANASRLSKFILDKMNLLTKTALDIWVIRRLEYFMLKLSKDVVAKKRRVMVSMGRVTDDSFGMEVRLPSFLSEFKHGSIRSYTEEIATLFNIRGKKLYGSQFMDKALTASVDYEILFKEEVKKHGKWITEGVPNKPGEPFPFESSFAFSASAICMAVEHVEKEYPIDTNKALRDLGGGDINNHLIHSSTLRGSLKEKCDRINPKDFGSTSLDEGLKFLERNDYNNNLTLTHQIAHHALTKSGYVAQYSMSEKEQRGGGRPIATPTYLMKAVNMCIERPEQALGKQYKNNIIVPGLNKLQAQSDAFKDHLQKAIQIPVDTLIFHATEDQTKFSESDNTYKYGIYLRASTTMPAPVRKLQYKAMEKMIGREHLARRMPKDIETDARKPYVNNDGNGIKLRGGWPQGMLNAISTTLHSQCDYYSYYLYRKAYPTDVITVTGLVHSDDSWFVMSCQTLHVFKKYMIFRTALKRMFCLKLNDKKFWASSVLGELVSNFNNNGDVSIPIMKTVNSGTQNLMYQSFPMDMSTQISTLQQLLRNGATNNVLIIMWTVLRHQLMKCYNIKDHPDNDKYPIELGGVPSCSAFELAVSGVVCHYNEIYKFYTRNEEHEVTKTILKILYLSKKVNRGKMEEAMVDAKLYTSKYRPVEDATLDSFNSISLMNRNEVFSAITQLMPKTKKVEKTVMRVKAIPFDTDGLEMLVTRPDDITVALGHLKAKLPTILFEFASENYTSSARRMAAAQAIRAQGRNYRLLKSTAITREELVDHVSKTYVRQADVVDLKVAFNDDTGIVDVAFHTVYNSIIVPNTETKHFRINKFPNFSSKFDVVSNLKDCLLWGVSKEHPTAASYISRRYTDQVLRTDFELIKKRFAQFFVMYTTRQACEYIIMMSWDALKSRLFIQPGIDRTTVPNFITSLYGSIVDNDKCNNVIIDSRNGSPDVVSNAIVTTIHSAYVLNSLYPEVIPTNYDGMMICEKMKEIDFSALTRNNTIKKAIIALKDNDREPMDKLYQNREVSSRWLKAQDRKNGHWVGSFKWIGHYQGVRMRVEGAPGNVTVYVDKPEIDKILHMMKYLVDNGFPEFSYREPGGWYHKSEFWITQIPRSTLKMVAESMIETRIVNRNAMGGLDLVIEPGLAAVIEKDRSKPDRYDLEANNTKVVAVFGNTGIVVARVPQTLSMPNAKKIGYSTRQLQGLEVQDLMETNMLMELTLGKRVSPNPHAIQAMLKSAHFDFDKVSRNFIRNFMNCISNTQYAMENIEDMTSQHDTKTEYLVPITATEYMEAAKVDPEEVCPMYMDECEEKGKDEREGGFKKVKAILHTICVNEYLDNGILTPTNLVYNYGVSPDLFDAACAIADEQIISDMASQIPLETVMSIFGNSLHDQARWNIDALSIFRTVMPESNVCKQFMRYVFTAVMSPEANKQKAIDRLLGIYQPVAGPSRIVEEQPIRYDDSDDDMEDIF